MIGIYKITSPEKKVYIGQSINIEERFKSYKRLNCKNQIKLYNSFLKYGINKHFFEIICQCDILDLNDKERYYQDLYFSIGNKGLNCKLTTSKDKSGKLSNEIKNKISIAHIGKKQSIEQRIKNSNNKKGNKNMLGKNHSTETKNKISQKLIGCKLSEFTRLKMSNSKKNKIFSELHKENIRLAKKGKDWLSLEQREKIRILNCKIILNLQTGIFYYGVKEAALSINQNYNTLHSRLKGRSVNNTFLIYV